MILITGGAGYIGSHAVKACLKKGYDVAIIDNLFRGYKEVIDVLSKAYPERKIKFYQLDLRNKDSLQIVFQENKVDAVLHFAALCLVNESTQDPYLYFSNNVFGSTNLIETMIVNNCKKLVFSSTSEVYGNGQYFPMDEKHPINPLNPYGLSKKIIEDIIIQYSMHKQLSYMIFRYFNVAGADSDGLIGDSKKPSQLLMQNAVRGALKIEDFKLTCPQVPTRDGTPVRDYVNIEDLVDAHLLALDHLEKGGKNHIINLGTGKGYSVLEIIDQVQAITGVKFDVGKGEMRQGEPIEKYASNDFAKEVLGWQPKRGIKESVESLVKWYKNRPHGWEY